ncbi:MAG: hypothetical protein LBU15_01190 [Rickettsiales bacterium]|jgi:hypothetical protein|nr:hypothetical protein [Rickettsiales bacterium]
MGQGFLGNRSIVKDHFKNRTVELAESEKLLKELDKRIGEAFKTFEEKLKELEGEVSELLDKEYEDYKKETTKEYGGKLIAKATPLATDDTKEAPGFLEGSEKLLVMWEQLYDLESRLKAGLEKFKEERGKIVEQTEKKKTEKLNIVTILKNSAKALDKETGSSTIPPPTSLPSNLTCFEGAEMSSPDNGTQPTVKTPEGKAAVAPPTSLLPSPPDLVVALGGAKTSPMEDTQPPSSQSELPVSADTRTNVNETIQVGGK